MSNERAIICVDDEPLVLSSLQRELNGIIADDYLIEIAEGSGDALELFEELEEDGVEVPLIISDYIMPDMKGDELLRRIHERSPKTRKVMLTGQADMEAVTNAVNYANLYRYIAKPWQASDLSLTVKEALRSYEQDKQLEEQNRLLQNMNAILEQQVKERTAELEAQKIELKRKNDELYTANASKDKFFSIISHDLKSPLSTLLGFAQLLVHNFTTYSPEQIQEYIQRLYTSADRLYALLENLLTWSRLQRGLMEYSPERISIQEIIEDNIALFAVKADNKNVSLTSVTPESELYTYSDYHMISTVVRNLVSNALKFTNPGDRIELTASHNGQHVEIAVADTGVGISAENLAKLFRMDRQYTSVGTSGETGTGLGLNLCKELVEKNGGRIQVQSQIGAGTTFLVTLPIQKTS